MWVHAFILVFIGLYSLMGRNGVLDSNVIILVSFSLLLPCAAHPRLAPRMQQHRSGYDRGCKDLRAGRRIPGQITLRQFQDSVDKVIRRPDGKSVSRYGGAGAELKKSIRDRTNVLRLIIHRAQGWNPSSKPKTRTMKVYETEPKFLDSSYIARRGGS